MGDHGDEGEQQHVGDEDRGVEHAVAVGVEHHAEPQPGRRHVHRVRGALRGGQDGREGHEDQAGAGLVQTQHDRDRTPVHKSVPTHHNAGVMLVMILSVPIIANYKLSSIINYQLSSQGTTRGKILGTVRDDQEGSSTRGTGETN